jgi:hypothetical protein
MAAFLFARAAAAGHAYAREMQRHVGSDGGVMFADAQIETVPAPTGGSFEHPDSLLDFLPSMSGLRGSYYALYEISANVVRAIWP